MGAYEAVAAAAMQTQEGAIGLRAAAQDRLNREGETLRDEVGERLRCRREAMSTAEDGLLKELKAAGKSNV